MKIALNWLQDYVKTNLNFQQLADRFVYTSSEVEEIIDWNAKYTDIVVGYVKKHTKHPDSDHLSVNIIDVGNQDLQIVCGAPNIDKGQYVPVALVGAVISGFKEGPFAISKTKIRGIESEGMVCSAAELGLSDDHDGIMVLDDKFKLGTPFAESVGLNDVVLDLEVTPNRADLNSYIGLAREVATFDKKRLSEPELGVLDGIPQVSAKFHVNIENPRACARYSAVYVENISSKPSPQWMQSRLILSGLKPINAVVDVMNYVMLEYGQPLHSFDYDRLFSIKNKEPHLTVRLAKSEEQMIGLDNCNRSLSSNHIVIDCNQKVVALAGIIGELESGINDQTDKIIIESANFSGAKIRHASRDLGLRTEASHRFEKGLDPEMTMFALKRAVHLLLQIFPEMRIGKLQDYYPNRNTERPRIRLSFDRFAQIIGINITPAETKTILQKLGFQITSFTKSGFEVVPPSWRADIAIPEDLVEELIRIWGYDRIPTTLPSGEIYPPRVNRQIDLQNKVRRNLSCFTFHETVHISLTSNAQIQKAGYKEGDYATVPHPLSQEGEALIPSHVIPLLQNIAVTNHNHIPLKLFEIGKLFAEDYKEEYYLTLIWRNNITIEDVYRQAKTEIYHCLKKSLTASRIEFNPATSSMRPYLKLDSINNINVDGIQFGFIGVIKEDIVNGFKIKNGKNIVVAEINLSLLNSMPVTFKKNESAKTFPVVQRDYAFFLPENVSVKVLDEATELFKSNIMESHTVGEVYRGKNIAEGMKSVVINVTYYNSEKTLTDNDVKKESDRYIQHITKSTGATLRD